MAEETGMEDPSSYNQEILRELEIFQKSRLFLFLSETMSAQANGLQDSIIRVPVESEAAVYQQEFKKGQIEGRLAFGTLVEGMISAIKLDLNTGDGQ